MYFSLKNSLFPWVVLCISVNQSFCISLGYIVSVRYSLCSFSVFLRKELRLRVRARRHKQGQGVTTVVLQGDPNRL